jgi:hypothetical protein
MQTKDNVTILYYTSNTENQDFENKIRERLKVSAGDIPIVSVSQKPIDLGTNICVGEVGCSYFNLFRQTLIGLDAIKTPFITTAEADCLYPKGYFEYIPKELDRIYRYDNVWILRKWRSWFFKKDWSGGAMVVGTEYYKSIINKAIKGFPMWTTAKEPNFYVYGKRGIEKWETFNGENAVINIKTMNGLGKDTRTLREIPPVESLPYWGSARKLKKELGL